MSTWQLEKIHHATGLIPQKKPLGPGGSIFCRKARLLELEIFKSCLKRGESASGSPGDDPVDFG